jgi:hypothetical protein
VTRCLAAKFGGVERAEAEAILDGDRETAVGLLLRLDELVEANRQLVEANERLEARVAELERRLNQPKHGMPLVMSRNTAFTSRRPTFHRYVFAIRA